MKLFQHSSIARLILCVYFFGVSSLYALTLHEAQNLLFKNNPELNSLQLAIKRSENQLQESKASLYPSVDAVANYSYTTEVSNISFNVPAGPGGSFPINRQLGDHDRVEVGFDASYPIFTGFTQKRNVQSKREAFLSKAADLRVGRNQASLKLAGLFYAWQLAQLQTSFQQKILDHSLALQKQLQDFVKAGTGVRSRALSASAKSKAAEVDFLSSQNTSDSIKYELLDFIGVGDTLISISMNGIEMDTMNAPIPDWKTINSVDSGDSLRPELQVLEHTAAQIRYSQMALMGQKFPQLYGMAGYRFANPGLNQTEDAFMNYGLVGLQFKWNLFDGSKNQSQQNQFEIQLRELKEQKRKIEGVWWKTKHLAQVQFERSEKQHEAAKASREAAEASANDLMRQFEVGLATGIDWLEVSNQAARASLIMNQARTMQTLAVLQWRYAAGRELKF